MISAQNLTKRFIRQEKKGKKTEFAAVDHISFSAKEGEILGILGPNGAGKTTLLRLLSGLMQPDDGAVGIRVPVKDRPGDDTYIVLQAHNEDDRPLVKRHIGYLSENTKLYGRLSVHEFLRIVGDVCGMDKAFCADRIREVASLMDMDAFLENRIDRLSTGQKQRVSIARCLLTDPAIYIFDEPTLGLDVISAKSIIDFMKEERGRGKTVLYSTHYMEEAEYLCDRLVMIDHGHIIAEGSPADVRALSGTDNLRDAFFSCVENKTKDSIR